jgi:hypothetical protein
MTYLNLRLTRWDDAVAASRRAVDADQTGLVPRQLLASALVNQVFHRVPGEPVSSADLVEACRAALWIDRQDRRSRFLARAAWEALRERSGDSGAEAESLLRARKLLMSVADGADLSLPTDSSADYALDDFAKDVNIEDGRPFQWRVIKECCPAEVELGPGGLRVTKVNPSYGHDAWIVTEEAFSGDVTLQLRADLGESAVDGNIHVDLGTASLYFAGVSRKGWCQLGRLDHSELAFPTRVRKIELPPAGDVILELRSRGDEVELRVWPAGSERPATATIKMTDTRYRLGSVAISTKSKSRPAEFRWVRLETASP